MISGSVLWPAETVNGLRLQKIGGKTVEIYDDTPATLYHALRETVLRNPEKTALVDNWGKHFSYGELLRRVDALALFLQANHAVVKGVRVGLLLFNSVEFCVSFLALVKLGAITVPLPSKYKEAEVASLAEKARIEAVICDSVNTSWFTGGPIRTIAVDSRNPGYGFDAVIGGEETFPVLAPQGNPDDPAIIIFTSGTTSQSKGVLLKNYNYMHTIAAYARIFGVTENDRSLVATPIYHITGMIALLGLFLTCGGTLWLHNKVDGQRMLACARDNALTLLHASPAVFQMLLDHRHAFPDLPALRLLASGSSNMPAATIRKFYEWLPHVDFRAIYGMTETSSPATISPAAVSPDAHVGSSGIPIPGLDLKIVDETGTEAANGRTGEILMRGTGVLERYDNIDTGLITPDGWVKSGDVGCVDDDGYLWVLDRKKDVINRGGEKICCIDIENELHNLPGVRQAAVVGIPDERLGEVPVAVLVTEAPGEPAPERIRDALSLRLAKFQLPVAYRWLDEIPMTPNGKIDKREIRRRFLEGF